MIQKIKVTCEVVISICFLIFILWSTSEHGRIIGRIDEQKKALEAGAAYYSCDPKTGAVEFKYNGQ